MESFHGSCHFSCDELLPTHCFASDASLVGGGAHYLSDWFYTNWERDYPRICGSHINELKLFTVVLALRCWGPELENQHVRVRSDNVVTVSALNKPTSRSPVLMPHVKEIFWLCVKYNVYLSCVHIPGVENLLADRISRLVELDKAFDARLLLANFSATFVTCIGHMSLDSFLYLQEAWIVGSMPCARRPLRSRGMPSPVRLRACINAR